MKKLLTVGVIVLGITADALANQTFSCGKPVVTNVQTDIPVDFTISCTNVGGRTFNGFSIASSQLGGQTDATISQDPTSCPNVLMYPGDTCSTTFTFTPSKIDNYVFDFIATAGIGGQRYGVFCNNQSSSDCLNIATRPAWIIAGDLFDSITSHAAVKTFAFDPTVIGNNNASPAYNLHGSSINDPFGIFVDALDNLWVANVSGSNVAQFSFPAGGTGGPVNPAITGTGSETLSAPRGVGTDAAGNIYVSDYNNNAINVYAPGSSGAASTIRRIVGSATLLSRPSSIFVTASGQVYVANSASNSILVFAAGATGNVAPVRVISGSLTMLSFTGGIWVTAKGNIWVSNGTNSIHEFAANANGNVAPIRTITGGNTNLAELFGIAVDAAGYIYAAISADGISENKNIVSGVNIYAPDANGDTAPIQIITGSNTGLVGPIGLAIK